jgi:hypothetical protein
MTIKRDDIKEPIEWTVENLVDNYGVNPIQAEFIVAVNTGEIEGDVIDDGLLKQAEVDTRLRTASSRLPMWINRYTEVVNTAKTMACANQKLMWTLGPTEHCSSCLKLEGKVKRGKFWQESGVLPQSRQLECGGFRCQCSLQPTDAPLSRGSLPRLP